MMKIKRNIITICHCQTTIYQCFEALGIVSMECRVKNRYSLFPFPQLHQQFAKNQEASLIVKHIYISIVPLQKALYQVIKTTCQPLLETLYLLKIVNKSLILVMSLLHVFGNQMEISAPEFSNCLLRLLHQEEDVTHPV